MERKIGTALVVGAGISGIRAALDLAETGYRVTLIEQSSHIGGILSQLDYQFPTNHCGMCKMLPLVERDSSSQFCLRKGLLHENIDILLSTKLTSITGEPGSFQVSLCKKPSWINQELCVGCGECEKVCPVKVPDSFNQGLDLRKAVYLPVPHAIPNNYVIDVLACNRCGECEKVCPTGAIQLSDQERKKFKILVVDDELSVRDSLKEWLDEEGFFVEMAESGQKALDKLKKDSYHLMLTDIKMPEMDGVQVLKRVKEEYPDTEVVMMTAYATVETAVEAMKTGAFDYVMKPFEFDNLMKTVLRIYENFEARKELKVQVGAIIFSGGTSYYDPQKGKNTFGYGVYPNVITSLEFERILSQTGPSQGRLVKPSDGKEIKKAAWIQCVGSRDIQENADFCSSICCMYSIKEAILAKEKSDQEIETVIFYMDMRTFGKSFQRYRDRADQDYNIRFERGKVHSVALSQPKGDLSIRYISQDGIVKEENFDIVVLAVGQRPSPDTAKLAEMSKLPLNPWGFINPSPFSLTRTDQDGILIGGSFSGLKDISESVIQASASAMAASNVIYSTGGDPVKQKTHNYRDVSREPSNLLIIICTCGDNLSKYIDPQKLSEKLKRDPAVVDVISIERSCTSDGWNQVVEIADNKKYNRILIASCLPYLYVKKIKELGNQVGLDPTLIDVVDIFTPLFRTRKEERAGLPIANIIQMGIAKIKRADQIPIPCIKVIQKALVLGGGIAGMTAALSIADHGFEVELIEKKANLGGNLLWLQRTLEGDSPQTLLKDVIQKVEKHSKIKVRANTCVVGSFGQVGSFYTTIEDSEKNAYTIEHGIVILATGGHEAATSSYSYGTTEKIVTQKEFEEKFKADSINLDQLKTVVMIQCVDSREEPKNYCSRICCPWALKNALHLKELNPDISIYILYKDIMTCGFTESYYTKARKAGVIFIPYNTKQKPKVIKNDNYLAVKTFEPIISKEIEIETDLIILGTGIVPNLLKDLAQNFGALVDQDGFFQEAESKWRPVDSLKEGVFACGLSHSPRSITESIATAEAAAQRALRILRGKRIYSGRLTAKVRHSLCSLCERCIDACPYNARILDLETEKILINPVMCQGCGSCATVCPNNASVVTGLEAQQIFEVIDAAIG